MAIVRDDHVVKNLESRYLKYNPRETYVACQDLDFLWTKSQLKEFESHWNEGRKLDEMSRYFQRSPEELLILALDRALIGRIKPRKGGLIGGSLRNY